MAENPDRNRQPPAEDSAGEAQEETQYTTNTPQPESEQYALLDPELDDDKGYPLGGQEEFERRSTEENSEVVMARMREATDDEEILEDFEERQEMPTDEQNLFRRLRDHHSETPELSGGDLDAAWDQAQVGDETATVEPTPDQDLVDEIGGAMGVTYEDDEELGFAEKVYRRDEERWELNVESVADDLDEHGLEEEDLDEEPAAGEPSQDQEGDDEAGEPFELDTTPTEPD